MKPTLMRILMKQSVAYIITSFIDGQSGVWTATLNPLPIAANTIFLPNRFNFDVKFVRCHMQTTLMAIHCPFQIAIPRHRLRHQSSNSIDILLLLQMRRFFLISYLLSKSVKPQTRITLRNRTQPYSIINIPTSLQCSLQCDCISAHNPRHEYTSQTRQPAKPSNHPTCLADCLPASLRACVLACLLA